MMTIYSSESCKFPKFQCSFAIATGITDMKWKLWRCSSHTCRFLEFFFFLIKARDINVPEWLVSSHSHSSLFLKHSGCYFNQGVNGFALQFAFQSPQMLVLWVKAESRLLYPHNQHLHNSKKRFSWPWYHYRLHIHLNELFFTAFLTVTGTNKPFNLKGLFLQSVYSSASFSVGFACQKL